LAVAVPLLSTAILHSWAEKFQKASLSHEF
jgi:hypothetical protein